MRLISLEPFITELVISFEKASLLVGVSSRCHFTETSTAPKLTSGEKSYKSAANIGQLSLADCLSCYHVDLAQLKSLSPDLILTTLPFDRAGRELEEALSAAVSKHIGKQVLVRSISPVTFEQVLEGYEKVATLIECKQKGKDLSHRCKAQVMDWADNFYERMKNKKVTFISSVYPLSLGGRWIVDMIKLCSAVSQTHSINLTDPEVEWDQIVSFRPDVIVVSPQGADIKTSLATFKAFEKLSQWEDLPAVKRGEVIFTEGIKYFHSPGKDLIDSMAILVSALAGFESGYITPRDSYFRLRWLELQRHKI